MNTSVDIEKYERKSESRKEYVQLLQSYAEKKIDPSTIYESFIKEYCRLLGDFIDLKNNFITSKKVLPLQPSTSSNIFVPTSPPQDPVADPSLPQKLDGQTFPKPSFKPAAKPAVVVAPNHDAPMNLQYQRPISRYSSTVSLSKNVHQLENQRSFVVTDLPESTSFDPVEKRKSDMADVKRILNYLQINVEIHKCFRFIPLIFPADRPPFIKVIVANEEEKKKVVDAGNANLTKIRLLDNKYAAITIRDAIKSGNGQNGGHGEKTRSTATSNNYARNTPSWNSSRSSFLESAQPTNISSNSSQSSYPLSPRPLNSIKFDQQPTTSFHSDATIQYTKGRSEDIYSSDEE